MAVDAKSDFRVTNIFEHDYHPTTISSEMMHQSNGTKNAHHLKAL